MMKPNKSSLPPEGVGPKIADWILPVIDRIQLIKMDYTIPFIGVRINNEFFERWFIKIFGAIFEFTVPLINWALSCMDFCGDYLRAYSPSRYCLPKLIEWYDWVYSDLDRTYQYLFTIYVFWLGYEFILKPYARPFLMFVFLRIFKWDLFTSESIYDGFWYLWWCITMPYRWIDFRFRRKTDRFIARILSKFGYKLQSECLIEDPPDYVPWFRIWKWPEDPWQLPTMLELYTFFKLVNLQIFLAYIWICVVQLYLGIPLDFEDGLRVFVLWWWLTYFTEMWNDPPSWGGDD